MTKNLAQLIFTNETLYSTESFGKDTVQEIKNISPKSPFHNEKVLLNSDSPRPVPPSNNALITPNSELISGTPPALHLKHPVLILVQELLEEDRQFLHKIIGAVGLQAEQVDIIELKKVPAFNRQAWVGQKVSQHFISFGIGLSKLGWQVLIPPYQIKKLEEVHFLLVDDLKSIANNVALKKKLWSLLQTLFPKT